MEFYRMRSDILPELHFIDKTVIEPPYIHKKRKAGEWIIYFILSGEMCLVEDGIPLTLRQGDICVLDKDRTHAGIRPSVCEYYYIHFQHPALYLLETKDEGTMAEQLFRERQEALKSDIFTYEQCKDPIVSLPKHWNIGNVRDRIGIEELLKQAALENHNPLEHYKVLCACKILEVLIEISRCFTTSCKEAYSHKHPAAYLKIQEILEWLNREYAGEISSELLETVFCRNFDYMNRVFKQVTGQTLFQYLTRVRISHAKNLILHTSMRMSEVGAAVGFPDEYYFSRVFKRQTGMSPAAYAKSVALEN